MHTRAALITWISWIALLPACSKVPRLGDPIDGLSPEQRREFEAGRSIFARTFVPEDGLGPLFNADACGQCHEDPVLGGVGDEVELHASRMLPDSTCDLLADRGGPVFQRHVTPALHATLGIDAEPVPADVDTARRTAPDLFGLGLLDAVPDAWLLAHADPDDANHDGISGRVNLSVDGRVGRFGRKALVPALAEFNAGAFPVEQGVTVPGVPDEGTVGGLPMPPGVDPVPEPELQADSLRALVSFVRFLAPPPRQKLNRVERRGRRLFAEIRCTACHLPTLRTGRSDVEALSYRRFDAYTDLLLHDMGPELADICFGQAQPSEFRTEPLMGLRFATQFLHDGRASTLEEAIRLHAGEASASRRAFEALPPVDRQALLAFLGKL